MKTYCRSLFAPWLIALLLVTPSLARDAASLVRVVDGDTLAITLDGQPEKVRLIGIDTPEKYESAKLHRDAERTKQDEKTIQKLGERASAFTQSLVHPSDTIELEYGQEARDKYHRLLAFVWLADGRMLNEVIICEGYANTLTRYPFRSDYMERFRACEHKAREEGKGLWAASVGPRAATTATAPGFVHANKHSMVYHVSRCPNYNTVSEKNLITFATEEEARQAGYRKAKNCP